VHVPGIELGPVPVQGVAIQQPRNPKGVVFIDLEGHVLRRLPEFGLFRTTLMPSVVAVTRGGIYYRLRPSKGSLDPIASRKKAYRWFPDSPTFEGLPAPQWHGRDALGAWSWAMRAPDGSAILAQWSGECESPTAFLAPASGGAPVSVTGERFGKAAESMALGWTANSEAVVILPNGACGSGVHTPGVYLFDAPGQGRLIFATTGYADARMWNSAGSLIVEPS
jgi:hypothetical protein